MSIKEFMSKDHRDCDELYILSEENITKDIESAKENFLKFYEATNNHFSMEEMVLFPMMANCLEDSGIIRSLEMEHESVRELLSKALKALEAKNIDQFLSIGETMMMLLSQHNIKEEQGLYALADINLADEASYVINRLRSIAY